MRAPVWGSHAWAEWANRKTQKRKSSNVGILAEIEGEGGSKYRGRRRSDPQAGLHGIQGCRRRRRGSAEEDSGRCWQRRGDQRRNPRAVRAGNSAGDRAAQRAIARQAAFGALRGGSFTRES